MWNDLRVVAHLARGRRGLYQYYTNVTWRTCEDCLSWHGCIRARPELFPDPSDGCARHILCFPVRLLAYYAAQSKDMAQVAERERERRRCFGRAKELLSSDPERALHLLRDAGRVDVYLPELEELIMRHRALLQENAQLRQELRAALVESWREKFALPRYERLPERMRMEHEQLGAHRIEELLQQR